MGAIHEELGWSTLAHLDYTLLAALREINDIDYKFTGPPEFVALNLFIEHVTHGCGPIHLLNYVNRCWMVSSKRELDPMDGYMINDGIGYWPVQPF